MRTLALIALIALVSAETFTVPGRSLPGGLPYELIEIKAVAGYSGLCAPWWWKDLLRADQASALGYTGKGVKLLIIDTGVDENVIREAFGRGVDWYLNAAYEVHKGECRSFITYSNVSLCVFASARYDQYSIYFAAPVNDTTDLGGHGTAVAAAALSVAPNATLYAAKIASYVLLADDQGRIFTAIPAVDPLALSYALRRAPLGPDGRISSDDAQVVNLSLGAPTPLTGPFLDPLTLSVYYYLYVLPMRAFSDRAAFVAAAGNEALGVADVPAVADYAIGVAALLYDGSGFKPTSFSNSGPGVDFSSLGAGLYLPVPKYSYLAKVISDPCASTVGNATYLRLDGTSFAAPLVSGVAAVWIQRTGASGTAEVMGVLKEHVLQPFGTGWNPKSGWGVPLAEGGAPSVPALPLAALLWRRRKALALALALSAAVLAVKESNLGLATFAGLWGAWSLYGILMGGDPATSLLLGAFNALVMIILLIISWIIAGSALRLLRGQ